MSWQPKAPPPQPPGAPAPPLPPPSDNGSRAGVIYSAPPPYVPHRPINVFKAVVAEELNVRMGVMSPSRPPRRYPENGQNLMVKLVADLRALEVEDRDPYPGEWFGLARRFVLARRQIWADARSKPRSPGPRRPAPAIK